MDEIIKQINGFAELNANWDTYGAYPISGISIDIAIAILRKSNIAPTGACPLNDGGILLVWWNEKSDLTVYEIEVDISPNGNIGCLIVSGCKDEPSYIEHDNVPASYVLEQIDTWKDKKLYDIQKSLRIELIPFN